MISDLVERHVPQPAEVDDDDGADEDLEQQDELALRDQVGLAGLVDQLGDLAHRAMHGHVLELVVGHDPEHETESAHQQPAEEERVTVGPQEGLGREVGNDQVRFARGRRRRRQKRHQKQRGEQSKRATRLDGADESVG